MTSIEPALKALVEAARPERIILFGSRAKDNARKDSDWDFLVIESRVEDRAKEPREVMPPQWRNA